MKNIVNGMYDKLIRLFRYVFWTAMALDIPVLILIIFGIKVPAVLITLATWMTITMVFFLGVIIFIVFIIYVKDALKTSASKADETKK